MTAPPFPAAAIAAVRADIESHLRIAASAEPALTERVAATALALCEAFTGTALIVREHDEILAGERRWQRLTAAPVLAVTGVAALDAGGQETALAPESHAVDIDPAGYGWIRVTAPGIARVRVRHSAGLAAGWGDVPPPLAQGVLLLAAHLFEARGGDAAPPAAVSALWRPWRRLRLRSPERAA